MNRSFFEDQVYDWGRFKKAGSHTRTKITPSYPLPRGFYSAVAQDQCAKQGSWGGGVT